tara:strand:+ start:2607 stop:3104 length:498 start_codon:yes stop_codon:yes gene_type:complete
MLFPPIFILFIITLVWEYVKEGGDFVMFSRMVELMNSVREDTPRKAQLKSNKIFFEYKFGDRIFGVLIPIRKKLQWKAVGKKNGNNWTDITGKIEHLAGPAKDFNETKLTPYEIDSSYDVLAFAFTKRDICYVKGNQKIFKCIKKFIEEKMKQLSSDNCFDTYSQ